MPRHGRRAMLRGLALAPLAGLAGCGFHPLYGPAGDVASAPGAIVDDRLAAVYVNIIPDRTGQLLRQALQERFEGSDAGVAKTFTLDVSYGIAEEGVSILQSNSATRIRAVGHASWTLRSVSPTPALVTSGDARSLDGYNVLDQQYFFLVLENEALARRMADNIADQITRQLAVYFRRRARTG